MKISIIIPVLNEAAIIEDTLCQLRLSSEEEVIVVDGGSRDRTVSLAQAQGAKVVCTAPGRAHQMNQGAAVATGKFLLFLHADTRLPPNYATLVRDALAAPKTVAGAFQLKIDGKGRSLRFVETMVNGRSRFLNLPYGDQAIFLKADVFREMGGFAYLPIMEDFELVQRLQRRGHISIVPVAVLTSGRRWQKLGVFKTTIINQLIIIGYFLGVPPVTLARWYGKN